MVRITGPPVTAPPDAFQFGRNWQRFVEMYLTPERVQRAQQSLVELTGGDIAGRSFLDIGCGSGLFSLVAHRLGADRVVSLDVDPNSVASCSALRAAENSPESWTVLAGSVLDKRFVESLPSSDIVYSWGVLHHTGDMYPAITNAARLVAPRGRFVIAVYNRCTGVALDSERWLRIKRAYNRAPHFAQRVMEIAYEGYWAFEVLRSSRGRVNPLTLARDYEQRGMALRTDLVDWLGGYPYEFASADEIVGFCEGLGLWSTKVIAHPPTSPSNNEFVFERPA